MSLRFFVIENELLFIKKLKRRKASEEDRDEMRGEK